MDPLSALLELTCCLLESADVVALIVNLIAWIFSKPNRTARKVAKTQGEEPPAKDFWFQVFVVLTPITITLTGIILYKWLR